MDENFYISAWLQPNGSYTVCADGSAEEFHDTKQVREERGLKHIMTYQTPNFSWFSVLDAYFKKRKERGPVTDGELAQIFRK